MSRFQFTPHQPEMSQSPSSAGAMGIGSMLNNQGGAPIMAEQHPGQVHPTFVMDRPNSPHGSEHSRYSGPMNTSYPSPTAMGAQLPPVPSANMGPGLSSLPPNMSHGTPPGMSPVGLPATTGMRPGEPSHAPPKAYPCSTCGKGFARRSDLARHGMLLSCRRPCRPLTIWQNGSTAGFGPTFATLRAVASSLSSDPP